MDCCIYDAHDELSVVGIFPGQSIFVKVVPYLYVCVVYERVLGIVCPADLGYGLPHFRGASGGGSLGIAVEEIGEDVAQNIVNFNDEEVLELLHVDPVLEHMIGFNCVDSLPEDGLKVDHDVLGCELLGLFFFEFLLAEEIEAR